MNSRQGVTIPCKSSSFGILNYSIMVDLQYASPSSFVYMAKRTAITLGGFKALALKQPLISPHCVKGFVCVCVFQ